MVLILLMIIAVYNTPIRYTRNKTMNNKNLKIGFTSCYIKDYNFEHKGELPVEVAVEWVKRTLPLQDMGNGVFASSLTTDWNNHTDARKNGWLNKMFVIVGYEHEKFIAIYNHDGVFSLYEEQ